MTNPFKVLGSNILIKEAQSFIDLRQHMQVEVKELGDIMSETVHHKLHEIKLAFIFLKLQIILHLFKL